jgi:DNA topoisomerase-1
VTRLRRVSSTAPGIARHRHGRGFVYSGPGGGRVSDPEVLARIRSLAVPPAWIDVWICEDPAGHLQAAGTDAAGRHQHLYHPEWRRRRDRGKFERVESFAEQLPALRRRVKADLAGADLSRGRVLACGVRMLDRGLFRVGGEDYTTRNGSFGLATLRREHVRIGPDSAAFDFVAKAGVRQVLEVADAQILPVLRALQRRRGGGEELLAWREGSEWRDVRSTDINAYLKEIAGQDFSAKDFRTWHATVLAAVALAGREPPTSATGVRREVSAAIKEVAAQLCNTPAVCRSSYIDPRVIDRFREGTTIALPRRASMEPLQSAVEARVVDLLRGGQGAKTATAA